MNRISLEELASEFDDEIWKDVVEPGYEGLYAVSNYGKVARLLGDNPNTAAGKHLKSVKHALNSEGAVQYYVVNLSKNGGSIKRFVHRLVAIAFVETDDFSLTVNHKAGESNYYKNLEWLTLADNLKHARETGLINNNGTNSPKAKLTEAQVLEIRSLYATKSATYVALATAYAVGTGTISAILSRRTWAHI